MRGSRLQGRFNVDNYESFSIYEGITEDLGWMVGTTVNWWVWDEDFLQHNYSDVVDDIYDVSSTLVGKGRRYKDPIKVDVVMARYIAGGNVMNTRGFYTTNTLRLVVNMAEMMAKFPGFFTTDDPSNHIKDHIVFNNEVYRPTVVMPRGHFSQRWAVVTIDCNQVNPEELVNDPQFLDGALPATSDLRTSTYGSGLYGRGLYGE
jgi:hypothetical protein